MVRLNGTSEVVVFAVPVALAGLVPVGERIKYENTPAPRTGVIVSGPAAGTVVAAGVGVAGGAVRPKLRRRLSTYYVETRQCKISFE